MSYKVKVTQRFENESKRLVKKYKSFQNELKELGNILKEDPKQGIPIGHDSYKIKLAIKSKLKGKSGGARIIIHVHFVENEVFMLTIYDKSEKDDILENELLKLIKEAGL
jgi:mRNA-degrading endonuclease RelE of RelBE toxin-antitoxin system